MHGSGPHTKSMNKLEKGCRGAVKKIYGLENISEEWLERNEFV